MLDLSGIRAALGVPQSELAQRMGISPNRISQIERSNDLKLSTIARYMEALGVHADLVLTGVEDEPIALPVAPREIQ